MTTPRIAVLIPVKDGPGAKSRLRVVGDTGRADLMAAFARDAISAASRVALADVYVVGDAPNLRELADSLDVPVLADEGRGDLNAALRAGVERLPRTGSGVAVMLADLPCLRPADLEAALAEAVERGGRTFVADSAGTGTTLLVAAAGSELDPRFGRGSAAAHLDSGAARMGEDLTSLRLDVDTTDDLERALSFGVGDATRRVAAALDRQTRD